MIELSHGEIQEQINAWMESLYDRDHGPDSVTQHVRLLVKEVNTAKLKGQNITKSKLSELFKVVENDINRAAKANSK